MDQIEQLHAPARVPLGNTHDEAQVGLSQFAFGSLAAAHGPQQHAPFDPIDRQACVGCYVNLAGSDQPFFDKLGEPAFVTGGEQVDLTNLTQIHPNGIRRASIALWL